MASLDSGTDNMIIYGCPPFVVAAKTLEPCIIIASFSAFMALIISSYARQLRSLSRLLFKHQHLNASPYGFAGVYRQCRCVITVCTRKSPSCHKVCNFNKIYCPFFRCNINKDNVHKSIISWSRSVHEKRCIGVSIKLNIYRKCWKISNINEDITILLSWKVFPSTPRISLFRPYCYFFAAERKSQLCSIYFITRVMLYNATPIAVQFRKPFRIYIRI